MRVFSYLFGLAFTLSFTVVNAQDLSSTKITEGIYMLSAKGGNICILNGKDGTFMIDDQFAPVTNTILAKIKELGGDVPRFVINTHFHGDHTGGNENLGKAGSTIVSHANVRQRLMTETTIEAFNMVTPPQLEPALPIITFNQGIQFFLNGQTIRITHVPSAHTDGDSIVHFPDANVIHTGDAMFNGFFPFIDTAHGGTLKGAISAADKIVSMSDKNTKIIPGHGPLANQSQLKEYRDMLVTSQKRLSKLKAQGKTVKQIIAEKPLDDLNVKWGNVMFTADRWIEIIFDGV